MYTAISLPDGARTLRRLPPALSEISFRRLHLLVYVFLLNLAYRSISVIEPKASLRLSTAALSSFSL